MSSECTLYSYWRSSCSWRVRIALELKKVQYEYKGVHLVKQEQNDPAYLAVNPAGFVPAFEYNGHLITESVAIIEYIDEVFPREPKLVFGDAANKALIRSLALVIVTNIQPLQNLGTLIQHAGNDQQKRAQWAKHFIQRGLKTLETRLKACAGEYSVGDRLSMVDLCIPSQVYAAERFGVDMTQFTTVKGINDKLAQIPEFVKADHLHQPDTPAEFKV